MNKSAFTLIEIVIIVIIVGVMASFAFPKYFITVEKVRANNARDILLEIAGAQKRYKIDTGAYSNAINDLDVEIPPLKNFDPPVAIAGTGGFLASIDSANSAYTLKINTQNAVSCIASGNTCATLGF